jgi:hypothetical protein
MVTQRQAVAEVRVLPPDVMPMSKQDEQQAINLWCHPTAYATGMPRAWAGQVQP